VQHIRRIVLSSLLIVALAACDLQTRTQPGGIRPSQSPAASPKSSVVPALPAATALVGTALPDTAALHSLIRQLIQLRGLQPSQAIRVSQADPAELAAVWRQQLPPGTDSTKRSAFGKAMIELGLMAPGGDLANDYAALADRPPQAVFDNGSRSILIAGPFEQPAMNQAFIDAYDRALLADHFGTSYLDNNLMPLDDSQRAAAALQAGDGALLAEQWNRLFGNREAGMPTRSAAILSTPTSDLRSADFASQDMAFRQQAGLSFVRQLYLKGGWAAVDKAHQVMPFTSEMILHPERFPHDLPAALPMPDLTPALPPGWHSLLPVSLGEWGSALMLAKELPGDVARTAAAGWGNDHLMILAGPQPEDMALVWIVRWDTIRDSQEFIVAMRTFGDERYGSRRPSVGETYFWPGGPAWLERASDQTLWITAPNQALGNALRQALVLPLR
jgi:hypothetical protein